MHRCKRCTLCGISYPFWTHNDKCDVCEGPLDVVMDVHDKDWKDMVELAKSAKEAILLDTDKVIDWRMHQLFQAGYDRTSAAAIAARKDIDLHHAVSIVQQGCAPSIAAAILL